MEDWMMRITSTIGLLLKKANCFVVLAFLLCVANALAQTAPGDVGLITKLSGEATYWNNNEQKQPIQVQAFMKLRQRDHLKLAESGTLQLIYFVNGRQETWQGPATIIVGGEESTAIGKHKPLPQPEVLVFPTKVTKHIEGAPLPLPRSAAYCSGIIHTRGAKPQGQKKTTARKILSDQDQRNIQEVEKIYQDMKKKAGVDDLTPELYFLGVLAEYKQYSEMEKLIDTMQTKRPGEATLKDLKSWVRSQSAARTND